MTPVLPTTAPASQPAAQQPTAAAAQPMTTPTEMRDAVQPSQEAQAQTPNRDSTAYAGYGAGAGDQQTARPPEAAPSSILAAQVEVDPETADLLPKPPPKLPDPLPTSPFLKPSGG